MKQRYSYHKTLIYLLQIYYYYHYDFSTLVYYSAKNRKYIILGNFPEKSLISRVVGKFIL